MKRPIGSGIFGPLISAILLICVQPSSRAATVPIQASGFSFSPANVSINVNDTVHWVNAGGFHDVNSSSGAFSPSSLPFDTFDVTFTSPGTYHYYCQIHDGFGMNGNVTVASAPTPPTVTITSPGNSSLFNAPTNFIVTATASATTMGASVSKVDFYVDGIFYATSLNGSSPYSVDIVNLAVGFHSLSAVVTDSVGGTATSQSVSIIVNALPTISITNLVNQAVFGAPATVVVKATAADVDGSIAQVEFFNRGTSLGTASGPAYQKTLNNLANGTYVLSAVATDDRGTTGSASVTVIVTTLQLAAPTISSGQFGLQLSGLVPGKTNLVQASTTLTNWVDIATNVAAQATVTFADGNATNAVKFYRVIQLP